MSRDIKIYLLIVVLPAILLVAGGIRLVQLESERSCEVLRESLQDRANLVARRISADLKSSGHRYSPKRQNLPHHKKFREPPPMGRHDCHHHDIPDDILKIFNDAIKSERENSEMKIAFEIRHNCGCAIIEENKKNRCSIFAMAPIKPFFGDWAVIASPEDGDDALALGIWSKAAFTGILLLLLLSTLTAGIALLLRAEKRAREEARRKTDFISNISHELKTPLTSIALFSEMLSLGKLDNESATKAASTIFKESKRLRSLIETLLDCARLEKNKINYTLSDFDIKTLLKEIAEAYAPSFPNGLIVKEANIEDLSARSDREKTRRILDCLVENAAKYAAQYGEVELVASKDDSSHISISVIDKGEGISKSDRKHIFERFWRADNSLTRSTGGAGIGLAIAKELAQGMGADLRVEENSPRGAIFILTLNSTPKGQQ